MSCELLADLHGAKSVPIGSRIDGDKWLLVLLLKLDAQRTHGQVGSNLNKGINIISIHLGSMLTQFILLDL